MKGGKREGGEERREGGVRREEWREGGREGGREGRYAKMKKYMYCPKPN